MYKVVEITKKFRNGQIKKILLIEADTEEDIDDQVKNWCESESSGASYGWTASYDIVEDKDIILKAFEDKIEGIEGGIIRQTQRLALFKEEYEKLK